MDKEVYMIVLTGHGDVDVKLVTKETYDWIVSDELGQSDEEKGQTCWDDISCPIAVRKAIWDREYFKEDFDNKFENFRIEVTIGSYQNDRALLAPPIAIDGEEASFWSIDNAMQFINKHGLTVAGNYDGYIY